VLDASFAGRKPIPVGFNMSLPGILVMYLFINLAIFGGSGIAAERRSGVLRRMSINPVTTPQLMLGKLYGLILLAGVQVGFFMILGQFVFDVNIGENLFGISVTLFVFSWLSASIGLLLGFVLKSEEKIIGLALLVGIPMAAIGGCWFPMEIAPEFVRRISYFFPTAWAMDSLHQLITFGSGFSGVLKQVGVLAAYAIGANLIAVRFFRV
jgi:ABC-type multidrug transport system permease subunit